MPRKNPKLTISEHIALGRKIKLLEQLQNEILDEVWRGYGKSCPAGVASRSIVRTFKLQSELDNLLARETTREEWDREKYGCIYFGPDINERRKQFSLREV